MPSDFDLSFVADRAWARRMASASCIAAWDTLVKKTYYKGIQLTALGLMTFFLCFRKYLA